MGDVRDLYPPSPAEVPQELTAVTLRYRVHVLLTGAALAIFVLCYIALLYAAYRLGVWLWNIPIRVTLSEPASLWAFVFKYASLGAIGLFFVFLLRPLFKWRTPTATGQVEITRDSAPTLFAFLDRLCAELGAPRPDRVFVDRTANATVLFDVGVLSLLRPPKKDLCIGLGLVNALNLSELKAVLAHEFGHFSQKSSRLGSYMYIADRVLHHLLFERDRLDEWLELWREIALPARLLALALQGTRRLLVLMYGFVMRVYQRLARQMELNADDVAVSVAGSDAIVHALYKLKFAEECLGRVEEELGFAVDQGIFTDDMFYHQTHVAERERRRRGQPRLGLPPELPEEPDGSHRIFKPPDEDDQPDLYGPHPTFYEREQNAKRIYVRCPIDERSAWLVFDDAQVLREAVTREFYRTRFERDPVPMSPAREVQKFIEAELAEQERLDRYEGFFALRKCWAGDPDRLPSVAVLEPKEIDEFLKSWPDQEALALGKQYLTTRSGRAAMAIQIGQAVLDSAETIQLGEGEAISINDARRVVREVDKELATLESRLHEIDRRYIAVHASIAKFLDQSGEGETRELARLQETIKLEHALDRATKTVRQALDRLYALIRGVDELEGEVSKKRVEAAIDKLQNRFRTVRSRLKAVLDELGALELPDLPNIKAGTSAYQVVVDPLDTEFPEDKGTPPTFDEFVALMIFALDMLPRLERLQTKVIAALVGQCERLAVAWEKSRSRLAETAPADRPDPTSGAGGQEQKVGDA